MSEFGPGTSQRVMASVVEAALHLLDAQNGFIHLRDCLTELTWENSALSIENLQVPLTISADIMQVMDQSHELAELLVHYPAQAVRLFQQLACQAVSALNLLPGATLHPSQVLVRLRPYNLATVAARPQRTAHLQACSGVLVSLTLPAKYVESTRYCCENSYCGEDRFHSFFPGRPEPRNLTDCTRCGANQKEDLSCRRMAEVRQGWLLPLEALESPLRARTRRYQSVRVVFRGEQCAELVLGGRYCVAGQLVQEPAAAVLEALSVRPIPLSVYAPPLTFAICPVIETLYHDRRFSPWSFALSLAYVFGSGLCPAGTYFRLKLGMLLSVVACGAIRHGRLLPLLAVGGDVGVLNRLLTLGASFCRRRVRHSAAGEMYGRAVRPPGGGVELEAGSLLLARGGVCLLGDLSKYRRPALQSLQRCMEVSSVTVVCPASLSPSCRPEPHPWPLLCQPWAVYDRLPAPGADLNASLVSDAATGQTDTLPRPLAEAFGMVYYTESAAGDGDDLACELSVCQLLLRARGAAPEPGLVPDPQLQTFLSAACELSLEMEPDAEQLVRRYFVASRRVRTSNVPDVPTAALHTISGLAHAFAQLSLRGSVTVDDVTMAILLYEESLAACFGYSPLGVSHTPHVREADLDCNLGRQNDERMRDFQQVLEDFIDEWSE